MAGTTTPLAPIDQQAWAIIETTYDTAISNASASALTFLDLKIVPSQEWHASKEFTGTGSLITEVAGSHKGTWSLKGYVKPKAAGTAPDLGPLLKAAFGKETIVGATSVTYQFDETQNLPFSLQVSRYDGDAFWEVFQGGWVEKIDFEIQGNGEPSLTFSGGFASYASLRGVPTTDSSTHAIGVSSIPLAASSAGTITQFGNAKLKVKFTGDNNSGNGYDITAVSADGLTITISPALAVGISASATITPVLPSATPSGTILGGIDAGLTLGSATPGFISSKVSLDTGITARTKEATSNRPTGLVRGKRHVSGEMIFYALQDSLPTMDLASWNGNTLNLIVRAGENVAAQRAKIQCPAARFDIFEIPLQGEKEAAIYTSKFVARKSASNGDEFSILLD